MQHTAKGLAALGRNGDTMLMHVNPTEVAALSKVLGPLSTNPKTGLPEAYGWGNIAGSVLGGIGSYGIGASLSPIISETVGEGLMGDILSKAVPALAGAGFNAAVGGLTGGKAGAMGGALQGLLSGGIGAYASEDLLGQGPKPVEDVQHQEWGKALNKQGDALYKTSNASPTLWKPDILQGSESPVSADVHQYVTQDKAVPTTGYGMEGSKEQPGFLDNLGKLGSGAFTKEGFKAHEAYLPYLFQAGMIGNALTSEQQAKDTAQQTQEQMGQYALQRRLAAQNMANQWYSGYAGGGPVVMHAQGAVPVTINIPEPLVQKVKDAGGLASFMQGQQDGYATGGYVNTQPFNPQQFYPQSRINSAQPYGAAAPTSVINTIHQGASFAHGGLIDGEGDGMSDDIDANIDGLEEARVADGEYVVPNHIAELIGVERLDELLKQVRVAAHGSDDQVKENAGLKAAQKELGVA